MRIFRLIEFFCALHYQLKIFFHPILIVNSSPNKIFTFFNLIPSLSFFPQQQRHYLHPHFTMSDQEVLVLRGTLEGHNGWVTSLATTPVHPDLLLSGSRDKTLIKWKLTGGDDNQYGVPQKSFKGHSHIVQDVTISADGAYALSASWDKTLRLWDLESGKTTRFVGHKGDVLSVSIAKNSRQIVSASRDKTVKVWNTIGECMATLTGHNDWVSAVRISPSGNNSLVISASWDKTVKVCF